jgi:hypothetical protein
MASGAPGRCGLAVPGRVACASNGGMTASSASTHGARRGRFGPFCSALAGNTVHPAGLRGGVSTSRDRSAARHGGRPISAATTGGGVGAAGRQLQMWVVDGGRPSEVRTEAESGPGIATHLSLSHSSMTRRRDDDGGGHHHRRGVRPSANDPRRDSAHDSAASRQKREKCRLILHIMFTNQRSDQFEADVRGDSHSAASMCHSLAEKKNHGSKNKNASTCDGPLKFDRPPQRV